jgi:hypothetical protein
MRLRTLPTRSRPRAYACRAVILASVAPLLAGICFAAPPRAQTATAPEAIGRLTGDDVAVNGAISFDSENGRSRALLASGSEITVRSGKARIDLDENDVIAVCGPAHFSILKAGGAITIALDYGQVHPQMNSAVPVTIFTPLIVATAVAIGDNPRDITVGLDQAGSMCVTAARGALRITEQLSGQGMLVPQGGQVSFTGGQLNTVRASLESCSCELLVLRDTVTKQLQMSLPIEPLAPQPPKPSTDSASAPPPPAPAADEPVYRISVPLTFDAASPEPPAGPDSQTILLVREARLEPEVIFEGHVVPAAPAPAAVPPGKPASTANGGAETKKPGLFARLFGIFRRRRGAAPCAGAGCATAD